MQRPLVPSSRITCPVTLQLPSDRMGDLYRHVCILSFLWTVCMSVAVLLKGAAGQTVCPPQSGCRNAASSVAALTLAFDSVCDAVETTKSGLEAKLAAMEQKLKTLEDSLTASKRQVGFTAGFSVDPVTNVSANSIYIFDNVATNVGDAYNPQTGIFTAPVAGLYTLHLRVMATTDPGPTTLIVQTTGGEQALVWVKGASDRDDQISAMVVAFMSQGQQAWVRHVGGATKIRGHPWTVFSGFLVQAQ